MLRWSTRGSWQNWKRFTICVSACCNKVEHSVSLLGKCPVAELLNYVCRLLCNHTTLLAWDVSQDVGAMPLDIGLPGGKSLKAH